MMIDRRGTLRLLFAGLAQASVFGNLGCATSKPLALRSLPSAGKFGLLYYCLRGTNSTSTLRLQDWETGVYEDFSIPLELPHSVTHDTQDPSVLYIFEVFGSCARVDLKTGVSVIVDTRDKSEMFNGHGVHSLSGHELLCTEITQNLTASTTIRDATTLKRISVTPDACNGTHHVVGLHDSPVVACGNLRRPERPTGGITFYDFAKHEVIRSVELPEPIIHVFPLSDEEVIGISRPAQYKQMGLSSTVSSQQNTERLMASVALDPGPIYYVTTKGHVRKFWSETKKDLMKGGFGIGKYGLRDSFLSSHSASNAVLSWRDGEIAKVLKISDPQTVVVSPDRKEFIVHSLGSAHHFDFETMSPLKKVTFERPIVLMGTFKSGYS